MIDSDWLRRCQMLRRVGCLAGLRVQTERLGKVRLQVRRCSIGLGRLLKALLLLALLLSKLEPLLEHLHHLLTLLLFIDQLVVEKLIDVRDWLINLA